KFVTFQMLELQALFPLRKGYDEDEIRTEYQLCNLIITEYNYDGKEIILIKPNFTELNHMITELNVVQVFRHKESMVSGSSFHINLILLCQTINTCQLLYVHAVGKRCQSHYLGRFKNPDSSKTRTADLIEYSGIR
ncbi:hypothetical protein L9F63_023709, partial [Diploptera punctata]